jgi:hypothetical protein
MEEIMPKLPDGVGTGKTDIWGGKSIGGFMSEFDANGHAKVPKKSKIPKISHPGKGNSSGDVGPGKPLRP